jgi:hypothetical protein
VGTQVGNPQNMIIGHFLAHFVSGTFARSPTGGHCWAGAQFFHFAFWLSKNVARNSD